MSTDAHAVARTHPELPAAASLDDRVLYRISGPGTDDFLQGQMSQNLTDVVPGYSPRAAASTPKGRAYLLTRLVRDGDHILLSIPADSAEAVASHLNKYLMLFRGTTMERLDQGRMLGLLGESAATHLVGDTTLPLPEAVNGTQGVASGYLVRTNPTAEGVSRFELWLPDGPDAELQERIDTLHPATPTDWLASEIAAGIAELTPATRETWVPQMLNWQHLDGVHFRKGCYTGQEVIARMHFLGQLKKSLFRLGASSGSVPEPGTTLMAGDKAAGEVVRAVALDDGSVQLLAVLRHTAISGPLYLGDEGPSLSLLPLPYEVPEREGISDETGSA